MKTYLLMAGLLLAGVCQAQTSAPAAEEKAEGDKQVFTMAEVMPAPDGYDLNTFLRDNIHYPLPALRREVQGRVYVNFIVTEEGHVQEATVMKGIGYGCDEEALRVVRLLPKWKPGIQDGKPVAVRIALPIYFKLAPNKPAQQPLMHDPK